MLAATLPIHPGLHLTALGPALLNQELLEKAWQHLENGLSADMGLLPLGPPPGPPLLPLKIDLDWFQPFDLNNLPTPEVSRRALHLALNGPRENLAFSVATLAQIPITSYPQLFYCLGNPQFCLQDLPEKPLPIPYTFSDWLKSTRTLPAQYLGLHDKGHLRPGARADIAFYDLPGPGTWLDCVQSCRMLLKGGELVVNNFKVVNYQVPKKCYYRRTRVSSNDMVADICRYHSFRPENLLVQPQINVEWQQVT